MSTRKKRPQPPLTNPVAKYAGKFNRAATFRDGRTYTRKVKHKGREPFPIRVA
ncbi:DUF7230 family protein [Methylocaldum szegediense]|uniref:DUF7230 family protein n=1 Tax=Methylocaldum szegediense TaxID=73780 RepID=UPI00041298E6|nr:hypothetical protein [Methylocaldum szegediense]